MATASPAASPRLFAPIVLIEDDDSVRESLAEYLEGKGYAVAQATRGEEGIAQVDAETEVVITDFKLPGQSGLDVLREVRRKNPNCEVIIVTGHGSIDSAVEAMKEGAYHYVTKPVNPTVLLRILGELVHRRNLEAEVSQLRQQLDAQYGFEQLIGRSPPMRRVFDVIRQVAPTRTTVLITGESGTGKELVARAIHQNSPRKNGRFVAINCAALPATLLESELFGHEKGAFTGAAARRQGLLQSANGGTLFIDEVGELESALQVKLLRVLESRTVTPLGSNREEPVDLRIVAATHQDLDKRVAEGKFREDFLYRLKVVSLQLPALRERREDVPLLARTFLEQAVKDNGLPPRRFTPEALSRLAGYHWPGNVRELRNVVESAAVMSIDESVGIEDLPAPLVERSPTGAGGLFHVGLQMAELERAAILATLKANGGNRTKTAETLAISLRTLQRKLKEYQVQE
ncbi:MAG: sigma-54-dependent Fis family transcriptional regulator [Planctomycetes bacterium]|nr:sigma-54-dependent Fis family transcriptional regulator [Planctomycetota bacterium]